MNDKLIVADGVSFDLFKVDATLNSLEISPNEWVHFVPYLVAGWEGITESDIDMNSDSLTLVPYTISNCVKLFSNVEFEQLLYTILTFCFSPVQSPFEWVKTHSYANDVYSRRLTRSGTHGAFSKLRDIVSQYNNPDGEKKEIVSQTLSQRNDETDERNHGNPYAILANEHMDFFDILRESRVIQGGFGVIYNSIHISEFINYYQNVVKSGYSFTARLDQVWGINRYLILMRKLDSLYVNQKHDEIEERQKREANNRGK